jgi:hypothetical protein
VCLLSCLLVALAWASSPTLAGAQQRSVGWERFDVDFAVQSDGSVQVTETQAIRFQGTYQQGFRLIPTDRVTAIDDLSVSEITGGQTLAYRPSLAPTTNGFRTASTDQGLRVDWGFPPTTDAARTFVLRYTLRGAIRIYDAGDQLEWKAVYADRPGPVAASTATVHLPADVSSAAQ